MPAHYPLVLIQGATFKWGIRFPVDVGNPLGPAISLAGATGRMQIRPFPGSPELIAQPVVVVDADSINVTIDEAITKAIGTTAYSKSMICNGRPVPMIGTYDLFLDYLSGSEPESIQIFRGPVGILLETTT